MVYSGSNAPVANLAPEIEAAAAQYGIVAGQLAAADGDVEAAYNAWKAGDAPEAVKIRDAITKLTAKLDEAAKANVKVETLSDEAKAKLTVEADALKAQVQNGLKAVNSILAGWDVDKDAVQEWLKEFAERNPARGKRGRQPGSVGSTGPRMRATVTVQGGELWPKPTTLDSMGKVANALKVETKAIQEAFASAAGVELDKISSVKTEVTFEFKVHENGAVYTMTTHPKV